VSNTLMDPCRSNIRGPSKLNGWMSQHLTPAIPVALAPMIID